jgi:hypothetical protein
MLCQFYRIVFASLILTSKFWMLLKSLTARKFLIEKDDNYCTNIASGNGRKRISWALTTYFHTEPRQATTELPKGNNCRSVVNLTKWWCGKRRSCLCYKVAAQLHRSNHIMALVEIKVAQIRAPQTALLPWSMQIPSRVRSTAIIS